MPVDGRASDTLKMESTDLAMGSEALNSCVFAITG